MMKAYTQLWNDLGWRLALCGVDIDQVFWLKPAGWLARRCA